MNWVLYNYGTILSVSHLDMNWISASSAYWPKIYSITWNVMGTCMHDYGPWYDLFLILLVDLAQSWRKMSVWIWWLSCWPSVELAPQFHTIRHYDKQFLQWEVIQVHAIYLTYQDTLSNCFSRDRLNTRNLNFGEPGEPGITFYLGFLSGISVLQLWCLLVSYFNQWHHASGQSTYPRGSHYSRIWPVIPKLLRK